MTGYSVDKALVSKAELDGMTMLVEEPGWEAFMEWVARMQAAWDKDNRSTALPQDQAQVIRGAIKAFDKLLRLREELLSVQRQTVATTGEVAEDKE